MAALLSIPLVVLRRLNAALTSIVKVGVVIAAIGMTVAILYQTFMRYVFNSPPAWTEELALLLFSWSMLLMTAVGVREAFHVRMDMLTNVLPRLSSQILQAIVDVGIAAFGGFLVWSGVEYCLDMAGATSAAIAYPVTWLYSAAPVSGALIFLYSLELLFERHAKEQPA